MGKSKGVIHNRLIDREGFYNYIEKGGYGLIVVTRGGNNLITLGIAKDSNYSARDLERLERAVETVSGGDVEVSYITY